MNDVAGLTSSHNSAARLFTAKGPDAPLGELSARDAFQEFVAGTFFQQMIKSLRETQEKPAYFHGGQAEEMFQSQLDQQVAEDLARTHGAPFADKLFEVFSDQMKAKGVQAAGRQVAAAYESAPAANTATSISAQV